MDTGVPIADQLQEALRAEPQDEYLINFLQSELNAEMFFARLEGNLTIREYQRWYTYAVLLKYYSCA